MKFLGVYFRRKLEFVRFDLFSLISVLSGLIYPMPSFSLSRETPIDLWFSQEIKNKIKLQFVSVGPISDYVSSSSELNAARRELDSALKELVQQTRWKDALKMRRKAAHARDIDEAQHSYDDTRFRELQRKAVELDRDVKYWEAVRDKRRREAGLGMPNGTFEDDQYRVFREVCRLDPDVRAHNPEECAGSGDELGLPANHVGDGCIRDINGKPVSQLTYGQLLEVVESLKELIQHEDEDKISELKNRMEKVENELRKRQKGTRIHPLPPPEFLGHDPEDEDEEGDKEEKEGKKKAPRTKEEKISHAKELLKTNDVKDEFLGKLSEEQLMRIGEKFRHPVEGMNKEHYQGLIDGILEPNVDYSVSNNMLHQLSAIQLNGFQQMPTAGKKAFKDIFEKASTDFLEHEKALADLAPDEIQIFLHSISRWGADQVVNAKNDLEQIELQIQQQVEKESSKRKAAFLKQSKKKGKPDPSADDLKKWEDADKIKSDARKDALKLKHNFDKYSANLLNAQKVVAATKKDLEMAFDQEHYAATREYMEDFSDRHIANPSAVTHFPAQVMTDLKKFVKKSVIETLNSPEALDDFVKEHDGDLIFVQFGNATCPHCQKELADLTTERKGINHLAIVRVSTGTLEKNVVEESLKKYGINIPASKDFRIPFHRIYRRNAAGELEMVEDHAINFEYGRKDHRGNYIGTVDWVKMMKKLNTKESKAKPLKDQLKEIETTRD